MTDRPVKIKTADGWQDLSLMGPQGPIGPVGPGGLELVYKYTVTGSDKASIDTGVDTPDAGTNDWTNGDLLEIFVYGRTDEVTVSSVMGMFFNNDTNVANYKIGFLRGQSSTASAGSSTTASAFFPLPGASATGNAFGVAQGCIPNFNELVGYKTILIAAIIADAVDGGNNVPYEILSSCLWKNTAAINRILIQPNTSGKKLKVGSRLLIYKRTSAAGSLDGGSP